MDNLKSLMDKKEYDLVIKLTQNSNDATDLFYCISALLALNKGEKALDIIKEKQEILNSRLPFVAKVNIEILCLLNKFDEAYEKLKYYEELPYFSQEMEEMLRKLPIFIRNSEKNAYNNIKINEDDLFDCLSLNKQENFNLLALDYLSKHKEIDINQFILPISNLMTNHKKQSIRSFALFALMDRKYDKKVKFNHLGRIIEVVPKDMQIPTSNPNFVKLIKDIKKHFKDISLVENAVQLISSYVIYIYPDNLIDDIDYYLAALTYVCNEMLQSKNMLGIDELSELYKLNKEKLNDIVNDIKKMNEDF